MELGEAGMMDISPYPSLARARSSLSTPSTPGDHNKRLRDGDDDITSFMLEQPATKQPMLTPMGISPMPSHSKAPTPCGDRARVSLNCCTPLGGADPLGESSAGPQLGLRWAMHQRQGQRRIQEDRMVGTVSAQSDIYCHGFFAVFDGHGGDETSEHCSRHLHSNVLGSVHYPDAQSALMDGFLRTDADVLRAADARKTGAAGGKCAKGWDAGTAAVVALVDETSVHLAHAGDCRALLVKRSGSARPYEDLTLDHTADTSPVAAAIDNNDPARGGALHVMRPAEGRRIVSAGGNIDGSGYVAVGDSSLPMTRALGDLPLKVRPGADWRSATVEQQVVTALPDVRTYTRQNDDLCVILASDGLFGNVMSSRSVADVVRAYLEGANFGGEQGRAEAPYKAAQELTRQALKDYQGTDNVSVVIVGLDVPAGPPAAESESRMAFSFGRGLVDEVLRQGLGPNPSMGAAANPAAPAVGLASRGKWPPLEHQGSQESLTTIDATSPGRLPLQTKLTMRFGEAYPATDVHPSPLPSPHRRKGLWRDSGSWGEGCGASAAARADQENARENPRPLERYTTLDATEALMVLQPDEAGLLLS